MFKFNPLSGRFDIVNSASPLYWSRTDTTLSPTNSGDNVDLGAGYFSSTGFNSAANSNVTGFLKCGANAITSGFGIIDSYGGGLIIDGYDDGYGRGGGMYSTRRDQNYEPFIIFTGYDINNPWEASGQTKQIWYGGVGFGTPDANEHLFFTANTYSEESFSTDTPLVFRIVRNKIWVGEHEYLPSYTLDGALPRYKLDFGDGNMRIRGTSVLGFGGDINTDYSSTLYDDGTFFHINTDKVIDINNQIQMNTAQPLSFMQGNEIRWWDNINNDGYDVTLYRGGDDLLKTDDSFQVPVDKEIYLGDPNTDGSWRFKVSSGALVRETRISGSWVEIGRDEP